MGKLIREWQPSESALELVRLNGVPDEKVEKAVEFLKSHDELNDIDDVDGYDNWDAFFIVFCVKAQS